MADDHHGRVTLRAQLFEARPRSSIVPIAPPLMGRQHGHRASPSSEYVCFAVSSSAATVTRV